MAAGIAFPESVYDGYSRCQEFRLQAHMGGIIQISLVSECTYYLDYLG